MIIATLLFLSHTVSGLRRNATAEYMQSKSYYMWDKLPPRLLKNFCYEI